MRIIESSWEAPDEDLCPDVAEEIAALIEHGVQGQRTYSRDEWGQSLSEVSLRSYTDPQGEERWAVTVTDANGRQIADTADQAEAGVQYEEQVRDLASCADADGEPWWEVSDVSGIALDAYTITVERRDADGEWSAPVEYEARLGLASAITDERMPNLTTALAEVLARLVSDQQTLNEVVVFQRAAGEPLSVPGEEAYGIRVSVAGTEATGEATYEQTTELEIPTPPTAQEIAAYRERMRRADEAEALAQARDYADAEFATGETA